MITTTPQTKPHGRALGISAVLHVTAILVVWQFGGSILKPSGQRVVSTQVFLPSRVIRTSTPPAPVPKPKLREFRLPRVAISPHTESVRAPVMEAPPVLHQPPALTTVRPAPAIVMAPPPPMPPAATSTVQVRTGLLDEARPAPTASRPALMVQVGEFGSKAQSDSDRKPKITAQAAGFDSAQGGRPETGERLRTAALGGFGSAVAAETAQRRPEPHALGTGFGDAVTAKPALTGTRPAANQPSDTTPIEITFKPRPQYTTEARQAQIEGEVLIEAMFTVSGQVQVLRIIRGLPHGLNDNAVTAVRSIRFRPARQHGQPVDVTATIRMKFELAY